MATWTNIPDSVLEPGKPARSVDALALRDNPVAIAEGAAGAPRVQTNGINNSAVTTAKLNNSAVTTAKIANSNVTAGKLATGSGENNWVRARTATSTVGQVGTYALLAGGGSISTGGTTAGSNLFYSSAAGVGDTTRPGGTWRKMGYSAAGTGEDGATVWIRIS